MKRFESLSEMVADITAQIEDGVFDPMEKPNHIGLPEETTPYALGLLLSEHHDAECIAAVQAMEMDRAGTIYPPFREALNCIAVSCACQAAIHLKRDETARYFYTRLSRSEPLETQLDMNSWLILHDMIAQARALYWLATEQPQQFMNWAAEQVPAQFGEWFAPTLAIALRETARPFDWDVFAAQIEALLLIGDSNSAQKLADDTRQQQPVDRAWYIASAQIALAQGRHGVALDRCHEEIDIAERHPEFDPDWILLGMIGRIMLHAGLWEGARDVVAILLPHFTTPPEWLVALQQDIQSQQS